MINYLVTRPVSITQQHLTNISINDKGYIPTVHKINLSIVPLFLFHIMNTCVWRSREKLTYGKYGDETKEECKDRQC